MLVAINACILCKCYYMYIYYHRGICTLGAIDVLVVVLFSVIKTIILHWQCSFLCEHWRVADNHWQQIMWKPFVCQLSENALSKCVWWTRLWSVVMFAVVYMYQHVWLPVVCVHVLVLWYMCLNIVSCLCMFPITQSIPLSLLHPIIHLSFGLICGLLFF